ncbi:DinB family protein [Paenibacillus sp. HN-1]|uniref:DinB family protein n=1 Tax=Paenibacillus TaxID=44249 RepID=UPI001CAA3A93|nr:MULTISPECIES: DinB family protein [Paenibacillus]MBY9078158.1 DinB family protein [Paenibacillus sp. CGMCC 1.18879]MBY9083899.1 DinB family protein [Paenibacillus sinensis]
MRSTSEALQEFEATVERYLNELDNLDMKQLLEKKNEDEWSIGQMYMHLIQSAQFMQLQNVDQCLAGGESSALSTEDLSENGRAAFEAGSFPPVRVRVPASPQYTPQQPESKEQIKEGLRAVADRMKRTEPALSQAPITNKVLHPRLGGLNATEWFLLVEMHYRHHFMQLDRLKSELISG